MAGDPYRYFRVEANELLGGLNQGILDLEKTPADKNTLARILRLAHTLKGAARVVRQQVISERAHAIEDILSPFREANSAVEKEPVSRLFRLIDEIGSAVKSLESPERQVEELQARPSEDVFEFARISVTEMDAVLDGVSEAAIQVSTLREEIAAVDSILQKLNQIVQRTNSLPGATFSTFAEGLSQKLDDLRTSVGEVSRKFPQTVEQVERELLKVRNKVGELRLLPAHTMFPSLKRAVRDAAEALQKKIDFEATGGDARIDAHVLKSMKEALLQIVRNAVAHGIENESERVSRGKPAEGRIRLRVERRSNRIAFVCEDDGRGLNLESIRRAAIDRKLVPAREAESLTFDKAIQLLLHGGISTTRAVTEVAGRGIGLDIVRENVTKFKGEVAVRSEPLKGTAFDICVPVSIESLLVLVVKAGGMTVAFPFESVCKTFRAADHEITSTSDGQTIFYENRAIPFLPLTTFLQPKSKHFENLFRMVVVIKHGSSEMAIGVDELGEVENVVMRPLPSMMAPLPYVAGAAFDDGGCPRAVIDPAGILENARSVVWKPMEIAPMKKQPVLVIDDSLTTRMLEQSILESAGYEVSLATSAEEGIEKANKGHYSLFLVDVEMPKMNGFEFIECIQASPTLKHIPAVLVTSCSTPEDRRRGERVGARGYIIKGEFDEGHFLGTIRGLIG